MQRSLDVNVCGLFVASEDFRVTFHCVKNGVFWDVTPCGSCKNRRVGGT
jgi:hypothetical protein